MPRGAVPAVRARLAPASAWRPHLLAGVPGVRRGVGGRAGPTAGAVSAREAEAEAVKSQPHAALAERCRATRHWVAFSDLHVSPKTAATCVEVLRTVAARVKFVAKHSSEGNAGVLFLGDFWHEKGALPVGPLNMVMREIATWDFPALFLVGNHDMADAAGHVHALTPIQACNPANVHVFDEPTVFLDALWVPYRRGSDAVKRALSTATATSAVFCHLDVAGATVNHALQARRGVDPALLVAAAGQQRPPQVYAGHYHLPHTIPTEGGGTVRYVGSPYQVTRAERGQTKSLVVLDRRDSWKEAEKWRLPLDIGPRHFEFDLSSYAQCGAAEQYARALREIPVIRRGDLVKFIVDAKPESKPESPTVYTPGGLMDEGFGAASLVRDAEHFGAAVEVVRRPPRRLTRYEQAESKTSGENVSGVSAAAGGPSSLPESALDAWARYCDIKGLRRAVHALGKELIQTTAEEASGDSALGDDEAKRALLQHARDGAANVLDIHGIELKGFGPFRELVEYRLHDRGCVLLVGNVDNATADVQDNDATTTQSNGAGKTALAFAALWALTGRASDAGGASGASGSSASFGSGGGFGGGIIGDVVNDNEKEARVVVNGTLRGAPWVVERVVRRAGLKNLSFRIGDVDLTASDSRKTQRLIDTVLGAQHLASTSFFSHSATGGSPASLLRMADATWKDRLMNLIDGEDFRRAKEHAQDRRKSQKSMLDDARQHLTKCETKFNLLKADVDYARSNELEHSEEYLRLREKYGFACASATADGDSAGSALSLAAPSRDSLFADVASLSKRAILAFREWLKTIKSAHEYVTVAKIAIDNMERRSSEYEASRKANDEEENRHAVEYSRLKDEANAAHREYVRAETEMKAASRVLQNMDSLAKDAQLSTADLVCNACGQAVHADALDVAKPKAVQRLADAKSKFDDASKRHAKALDERDEAERELNRRRTKWQGDRAQSEKVKRHAETLMLKAKQLEDELSKMRGKVDEAVDEAGDLFADADPGDADPGAIADSVNDAFRYEPGLELTDEPVPLTLTTDLESLPLKLMHAKDTFEKALGKYAKSRNEAHDVNSNLENVEQKLSSAAAARTALKDAELAVSKIEEQVRTLDEVIAGLGNTGVVSYALDGAVAELEFCTAPFLDALSDGRMRLKISTTRPRVRATKRGDGDEPVLERVTLTTFVRSSGSSVEATERSRTPVQLSGGEGKRVALALALGYALAYRNRSAAPRCSLLVLDEVLLHLDQPGRDCAWALFRSNAVMRVHGVADSAQAPPHALDYSTVLVVAQRGDRESEAAEGLCDATDVVVRDATGSRLGDVAAA